MNPSITMLNPSRGLLWQADKIALFGIAGDDFRWFGAGNTAFVYLNSGHATVSSDLIIRRQCYGCVVDDGFRTGGDATGFAVVVSSYRGMRAVGGPIEETGRLKYIDGCTDSLLIPPVKLGDPCLNLLHFPKGIAQSMHTHPSVRIGMVVRGRGMCITPFGEAPLWPGMIFVIHPADGKTATGVDGQQHPVGAHCFHTTDSEMAIVAFHPDSLTGPTDEDHPMLAATDLLDAKAS